VKGLKEQELLETVNSIIYASKGKDMENLTPFQMNVVIDGLSSALGMSLSHIMGNHKEPWTYIKSNVLTVQHVLESNGVIDKK
jgi:hypothetical protein